MSSFPWWSLLLMGVGVLAIGTLFLNLFSSVGDRPDTARQAERCDVGSPQFLRALAGVLNAPLERGGSARLLNNGDEIFPAILDRIRQAERSVCIAMYIWEDGEVSNQFFRALIERASAGVQVRVLVDGFGALKAPPERVETLKAAGGQWAVFHSPRFGRLTRLHRRTHRRAIIVDGRVGFTGGVAVSDHWLGHAQDGDHWRDCMVEVHGPLARGVLSAFSQIWAHATGELIAGDAFYPDLGDPPAHHEAITRHVGVISSPSAEAHPMRHLFWFTIQSARERVYASNPYFVPDDILKAALIERARAGVDVRFLVPSEKIDIQAIRWASQSYYEELLESGVRIYEYQPTLNHQKLLVADGLWTIVGSVNMDVRSKELNQENALGILDRGFAETVERTFLADLENAVEIDLDRWRRRPVHHRIRERFFRLFEEQF